MLVISNIKCTHIYSLHTISPWWCYVCHVANIPGGIRHFSSLSHHYYYFLDWQVKSVVHLHLALLHEYLPPQTPKFWSNNSQFTRRLWLPWVICSRQKPRTYTFYSFSIECSATTFGGWGVLLGLITRCPDGSLVHNTLSALQQCFLHWRNVVLFSRQITSCWLFHRHQLTGLVINDRVQKMVLMCR